MSTITKVPLTANVGVEISGVTGHELVDRTIADDCRAALRQYGVVVFRDAHVDDDDLVAFSRLLGEVSVVPTGEHERPEIQTITLDPTKTDARLAAYRQGNFLWHIDGATEARPQKGTLLSAREVADEGGDTEFASTYAAYDALPDDDKATIDGLSVVHSLAAALARANPAASDAERSTWNRVEPRVHPLVWKRRDGRRSMLLGATAGAVVGWPRAESDALLERLLEWSTQQQFVVRHRWRRGDLVTWDNTGMLHRAMPFAATSRRLLHRTTLVGEESIA
jgi:alpha-ketoglutarate-dependent taurine dioxygenase